MRVLMIGWEYPPRISGGLGTACHGLTRALAAQATPVTLLLPFAADRAWTGHVRLLDPTMFDPGPALVATEAPDPYGGRAPAAAEPPPRGTGFPPLEAGYGGDLPTLAARYAAFCVAAAAHAAFDVVHAHDWLTFPAARAVARAYQKPLAVHVHATAFDRGGSGGVDPVVAHIEQRAVRDADAVLTVSALTADILHREYGAAPERMRVIHNGVTPPRRAPMPLSSASRGRVLFLGRMAAQKAPLAFLEAAALVHRARPDTRFVMAGGGELLAAARERARELGLENAVAFPGFLRGAAVQRAYEAADVYVMPSESEPFGLTALEAMRLGVPALLSRRSGAAEVFPRGALQVDPADPPAMARQIEAVLSDRALRERLRTAAHEELRALTWESAARKCRAVYAQLRGAG